MTTRRVTISEEVYRSLRAEGLVTGESPGDVLARVVGGGISPKAREILSTIGETSATEKRKIGDLEHRARAPKRQLAKNPEALAEIKRLWRSGERDQAKIGEAVGYARSTVGGRIRAMLEAGELEEEVAEGEARGAQGQSIHHRSGK